MDSRLRGNDGGWRSARSPSPHRGWIPAFAGMTVVGVRRGHPHPAGDGFPPSRERRWLAFGAVTLAPPGMDSRVRGNDGGWRSARSASPRRGWIPAFAGTTVVGVRRGQPRPAGDGFPRSRERRWLAFGAVSLTPPGMDSRLRGNDGGWRSARSPSPRRGWIPAFAGTTVVGVRRGHPHPAGDGFPPSRERRWLAFGAVTLTPPGMDSRLRGNDGGWRSARSPSPRRGWIPAFAGMTVVGVRRGHPHPTGDGFPPSRERRWLAFGGVTLAPQGMDSRLRGNDGGWRSARSPSPRRGWIPAFAGTTVVGVRRGQPRPAGDGFPRSRERRWLAFGAVSLTPPGMDSRVRGNDGGWRSARSASPRRGWIPAFAGTTVVGVRRGHPHPTGDGFPPSRE